MTPLHEAIGRRRRTLYVPSAGESVQQNADRGGVRASDPPIYRELLRHWAGKGKTLPGHRDPEWARLTAPIVRPGEFGSGEPFGTAELFGAADPFGPAAGTGARPPRQYTPGPGQFGESRESRGQFGESRESRGQYGEPRESRGQFDEPRESHDPYSEPRESRGQFSETRDPRGDGR
ncbi:hypothetical protein SAMN05421806_10356 [Streptomyces indicus]|uniref:Uncharacterized protein n=1 Tax=Streptomyces indicus TaxID=417292 RepID=A0A1G8X8E8_9ACTN|nr:hypothetical protein SAMN05421806_10356 [Streptomyces indicus]